MTTTPAALWVLRLLPLLWFGLILTADVSAVTETARTLIDEKGLPPAADWLQHVAQNARSGIVAVGADSADSEKVLRFFVASLSGKLASHPHRRRRSPGAHFLNPD